MIEFIQANASWIVLGVLFVVMMRMQGGNGMGCCGGGHNHSSKDREQGTVPDGNGTAITAKDPVCDMPVDPVNAPATTLYNGRSYHFCSMECKAAFEKNPEKFVQAGQHNHRMLAGG